MLKTDRRTFAQSSGGSQTRRGTDNLRLVPDLRRGTSDAYSYSDIRQNFSSVQFSSVYWFRAAV